MSLNPKIASYIGFSVKARKVVYGYESVLLAKKRIYLILCDKSLSENSLKKVVRFGEQYDVKWRLIDDLSDYFGGKAIKCVGLAEEHLASAIETELNKTVGGSN